MKQKQNGIEYVEEKNRENNDYPLNKSVRLDPYEMEEIKTE